MDAGQAKHKLPHTMKKVLLAVILLIWPLAGLGDDTMPMPEYSNIPHYYYHTYMAPQGCSPIKDFYYDSPFVFTPPYLVTEDFTEGEQTLIMACESNNPNDITVPRINRINSIG